MARGERVFAALLGLFGVLWAGKSLELTYMGRFAPGAGFLPFWLGLLLVGLSLLVLYRSFFAARAPASDAAPSGGWRRIGPIVLGLVVAVAVIEWVGFAVAVAVYLVLLVRFLERRPWPAALGLALGATAAIFLIFKVWLRVPLPVGPWGF